MTHGDWNDDKFDDSDFSLSLLIERQRMWKCARVALCELQWVQSSVKKIQSKSFVGSVQWQLGRRKNSLSLILIRVVLKFSGIKLCFKRDENMTSKSSLYQANNAFAWYTIYLVIVTMALRVNVLHVWLVAIDYQTFVKSVSSLCLVILRKASQLMWHHFCGTTLAPPLRKWTTRHIAHGKCKSMYHCLETWHTCEAHKAKTSQLSGNSRETPIKH